MGTFVQFGAGNIGRSFIGRLFSEAGYETVFVDVDAALVGRLNEKGRYPVVIKQNDQEDEVRWVGRVRAIHGLDRVAVLHELVEADFAATSVGPRALPSVLPLIAEALVERQRLGRPPLDIIIAENLRSGAQYFREGLSAAGGVTGESHNVGLVETSIGKMVPLMPAEALAADPLVLLAVVPTAGAISAPVGRKPRLAPGSQFLSVCHNTIFTLHFCFSM